MQLFVLKNRLFSKYQEFWVFLAQMILEILKIFCIPFFH